MAIGRKGSGVTGKQDKSVPARSRAMALSRRSALLTPLALTGCGLWDEWFGEKKTPLPGKREPVIASQREVRVNEGAGKVVLPPAVRNAAWPQTGGNPAHMMGHLQASESLTEIWRTSIGSGGGYRNKILAQPLVADGIVYAMDSDAEVSAFDLGTGSRRWRFDTRNEDADSSNVGGGMAVDQGVLYAANGLGDLVALDAASGAVRWRAEIGAPTRSAPTVAEGRIFLTTVEDRLVAFAASDGHVLWSHRAASAVTSMLGRPAPAFSRGLVVGGFGSGELAAVRADTGRVAWTDGLGASRGKASAADLVSIRGAPVISDGRVFGIGLGGLAAAIDLPTGRRLWERPVAGECSPAVAGNWMFIVSSDQELMAINAVDGRVAWICPLPRWDDPEKRKNPFTWYGPLLVSDRLIVAGTSEEALAVSPYTGEILGRQRLSGAASPVSPAVAEGVVLIVTEDGRLLALR